MPQNEKLCTSERRDSPPFRKPSVIVNTASGTTSDISCELTSIFKRYNYPSPKIHLLKPSQISQALEAIKNDGTDLLVIYGGDGSCKAGAIAAYQIGVPLIPLPGGTMNMLPKALYNTDDWRSALDTALSQDRPRWQPCGKINGELFLCGAILGDPVKMADARESFRDGEVVEAVKQIPDIMTAISDGETFRVKADDKVFEKEANGLQIYCPYMTSGATLPDAFEIASVPHLSMSELIEIGAKALAQDWRDSVNVVTAHARSVEINYNGTLNVLLDGEPEQVICPAIIKIEKEGVLVMAPISHVEPQS